MFKSIITFLKNWTLPSAIVGGTLIYLLFYYVPQLDGIGDALSPFFDVAFPLFMGGILFVTFCRVDFHKMRPTRWHLWLTVFQLIEVAAIAGAIILSHVSDKSLALIEGILTCVIGPGAAAAAVVTGKLGGNLESMTTYTFISNIVTALMVPLVFPLIDNSVDMPFLASFFTILVRVCMVLILPMLLAYIVKHWMPRLQQRIVSVPDLSFYMWGISLSIVTGFTVKSIIHSHASLLFLAATALVALLLCFVQFAAGRYIGHYFGAHIEGGQGLGQKNTAFAVWIAHTYLNPLSVAGPGFYIIWQNLVNSVEIWHHARSTSRSHADQ